MNERFVKYEEQCMHVVSMKIAALNEILESENAGMKVLTKSEHLEIDYKEYLKGAMAAGEVPLGIDMYKDRCSIGTCAAIIDDPTVNSQNILAHVLGVKCADYRWDEKREDHVIVEYKVK